MVSQCHSFTLIPLFLSFLGWLSHDISIPMWKQPSKVVQAKQSHQETTWNHQSTCSMQYDAMKEVTWDTQIISNSIIGHWVLASQLDELLKSIEYEHDSISPLKFNLFVHPFPKGDSISALNWSSFIPNFFFFSRHQFRRIQLTEFFNSRLPEVIQAQFVAATSGQDHTTQPTLSSSGMRIGPQSFHCTSTLLFSFGWIYSTLYSHPHVFLLFNVLHNNWFAIHGH